MTGQLGSGAEPRPLWPELGCGKGGESGVERNGAKQSVAAPFLGIGGDHAVGGHHGQAQSSGSRHRLVPLAAWAQLGVEMVGATQTQRLFQKRDAAREQKKSLAIVSYGLNEAGALRFAGSIVPMNAGYCSAEC